jgi:hypothetical protein
MGMTLFPSMAKFVDPKDSTYKSLKCEVEKKDQR